MATIKLEIDIPADDRKLIDNLGRLANETLAQKQFAENKEHNTQVYAVRGRTLDQVKRLYAVVMGFALTTCIANAYLCFRKLAAADTEAYLILAAAVFSFVSLIALFYLGAERMLEEKYLKLTSKPASRFELFGDILTLWATAGWFVVIANSFPVIPPSGSLPPAAVHTFLGELLLNLTILYVLDVVFLLLQIGLLAYDDETHGELISSHWIWLGVNVVSGVLVGAGYKFLGSHISVTTAAWALIGLHAARFFGDYYFTFESYYPQDETKPTS